MVQDEQKTNLHSLGMFLDGYAVLVEKKGGLAQDVRQRVYNDLNGRQMPDVRVKLSSATPGITGKGRDYTITTRSPGATTTIYIGDHGSDLYAAWRTFIRPIPNLTLLGIMVGIAVVISVCNGIAELASMRILARCEC